ncbi:MAG: hypothetical protein HHJ13_02665 [Phycicoccus sp.]|nr:hypothetical protein [Phycicoccus sp.]
MSETSVPDQSELSSDKLVALADNEHHSVDTGDSVDGWYRPWQHVACRQPALEWRGPVSFARAHAAVPGIERDFGSRWGSNGDQRVSVRVEVGSDTGLLYVYDPTWDEYAVIGSDVPLAAVEDAFARATRLGEHPTVADFVTLLPNVHADRRSPGPEL